MTAHYNKALGVSIAALVSKQMLTHVLTVRCRLNTLQMNKEVTPESEGKNWDLPVLGLFQMVLGATVGPLRDENTLEVSSLSSETMKERIAFCDDRRLPTHD